MQKVNRPMQKVYQAMQKVCDANDVMRMIQTKRLLKCAVFNTGLAKPMPRDTNTFTFVCHNILTMRRQAKISDIGTQHMLKYIVTLMRVVTICASLLIHNW